MTPFILLFFGLLLILLEFFIPGAVVGTIGGMMVVASIVLFAMQSQSPLWISVYSIGTIVLIGLLIKFALWRIPRAKAGQSIYLKGDQAGYQASSFDVSVIGKQGVVVTDLKPGGHILVDGKRLQAISQSGYLVKGTEVVVLGGQEESLIVKRVTKDTSL